MKQMVVLLVIGLITVVAFQNCGNDATFSEGATSENPFGTGQTRRIVIDPNMSENRPPIHLSTIADNSFSTSQIHQDLVNGFSNAVGQLQGFNVVASLHTTSQDPVADKSSAVTKEMLVYSDSNNVVREIPKSDIGDIPGNTNYLEKTYFDLSPSFFTNGQALTYNFLTDDFLSFSHEYSRSVAALGTDGADEELGLCTLIKKIEANRRYDDPENRGYHVYVLATNENDFSTLQNCPLEESRPVEFVNESKQVNCSTSDPDCQFPYTATQDAGVQQVHQLKVIYQEAKEVATYSGSRIEETYSYAKETAVHKITYQKRQATYKYDVVLYCLRDNIKVPCATGVSKSKTVIGQCSFSGSRNCNATDNQEALALFNLNSNGDMNSCKATCQESWENQNLAASHIPSNGDLCISTSRACNSGEVGVISGLLNTSNGNVNNCSYSCTKGAQEGSKKITNARLSCPSTTSRACSTAEVDSYAVPGLNVQRSLVASCDYSCREIGINNARKTFKTGIGVCTPGQSRNCTAGDRSLLQSKNINIDDSNISQCTVSCSSSAKSKTTSLANLNSNICPSTVSCNSSQKDIAAQLIRGNLNDVERCDVICSEQNLSGGTCRLSGIQNANLCSDSHQLSQLCAAAGINNVRSNSCARGSGKKTVTSVKKVVGAKEVKTLAAALNANSNTPLPNLIAKRLKDTHGDSGYFASFFIHPSNDPSCRAPATLSAGVEYEKLASQLGAQNASINPVCLDDYSPALDSVIKIAIDSVLSSYNLDISDKELVYQIDAVMLDGSRVTVLESQYTVVGKTVKFKDKKFLKDVESLEFAVWRP